MILHKFAEICISKELFLFFFFFFFKKKNDTSHSLKKQVRFQGCFQLKGLENLHLGITESNPTILYKK